MGRDEIEKKNDDEIGLFEKIGLLALIGGGLLLYYIMTSPKAKTFIGGGMVATGAKIIRDNWDK